MIDQHWWSVQSPIMLAALGLLAVWPFGRKESMDTAEDQHAFREDEASPEIDHLDWGIRLGMLERYERAIERFRMAVDASPEDPAGHYNLALALDSAGQHEEAKGIYKRALEMDPGVPDARVNLAVTLLDLGDSNAAADALRTAMETAPDDPLIHYDLGCVCMTQRRWSDAVTEFRAAVSADSKDAQTRFNLAVALRKTGSQADAERELRDFLVLARGRYLEQREYAEQLLRTEYEDTGEQDAS